MLFKPIQTEQESHTLSVPTYFKNFPTRKEINSARELLLFLIEMTPNPSKEVRYEISILILLLNQIQRQAESEDILKINGLLEITKEFYPIALKYHDIFPAEILDVFYRFIFWYENKIDRYANMVHKEQEGIIRIKEIPRAPKPKREKPKDRLARTLKEPMQDITEFPIPLSEESEEESIPIRLPHFNINEDEIPLQFSLDGIQLPVDYTITNHMIMSLPSILFALKYNPNDNYYLPIFENIKNVIITAVQNRTNKKISEMTESEIGMNLYFELRSQLYLPQLSKHLADIDWEFLIPNYNNKIGIYLETIPRIGRKNIRHMRKGYSFLERLRYAQLMNGKSKIGLLQIKQQVIEWLNIISRDDITQWSMEKRTYFIFRLGKTLQNQYQRLFQDEQIFKGKFFNQIFWEINWDFLINSEPQEP